MLKLPSYVLVTPARNEAQLIESTIQSVVGQTVLPLKWVIVSDGSTDGTDVIVQKYSAVHEWIELVRTPERKERHFAGKVDAFNAGMARMSALPYEAIASLDADITFGTDYFEFLLTKLAEDPRLGLIGTPYEDKSGDVYDYHYVNIEDVSGACQVFRRECYEAIGGYVPVRTGAIDTIAVFTARMKGWKTRTFTERICQHHRKVGTAQCGRLRAWFNEGSKDYALGNHPIWQMFRTAYQSSMRPLLLRGLAIGAGFLWQTLRGAEHAVSPELMKFHRREQMQRLARLFTHLAAR
jgi:biofilm PGA synthesis N-glycosyltransferase PgaC